MKSMHMSSCGPQLETTTPNISGELGWRTASQRMHYVVQLVSRVESVSGKALAEESGHCSPWEPQRNPPSHSHLRLPGPAWRSP